MQSHKKLLVIALAEATFDLFIPWMEEGELPTFKKFFESGSTGVIKSSIPMITPQLWGNITTGKNSGRHGLFDFWQRGNDGKFKEVNGSQIKVKPIWKLLSESGLSSGIVKCSVYISSSKNKRLYDFRGRCPGCSPLNCLSKSAL